MKKTIVVFALFLAMLCLSVQSQSQNITKPPFVSSEDTMETVEVFVMSPISVSGNTKNQSVNIHFLGMEKNTAKIYRFIAGIDNSFRYDFTVGKTKQDVYDELENIVNLAEKSLRPPESTIFIKTSINFNQSSSRVVYEAYEQQEKDS